MLPRDNAILPTPVHSPMMEAVSVPWKYLKNDLGIENNFASG